MSSCLQFQSLDRVLLNCLTLKTKVPYKSTRRTIPRNLILQQHSYENPISKAINFKDKNLKMFNSYCVYSKSTELFSWFVFKHNLSVNDHYLETTDFFAGDFMCYIQPVISDSSDVSNMPFCK
jgi:hypothetical protein